MYLWSVGCSPGVNSPAATSVLEWPAIFSDSFAVRQSFSVVQSDVGVNLLRCPFQGRLTAVLNVFPLVNNLSSIKEYFRSYLITLPRLTGSNNCFSKIVADVQVELNLNAPDLTKSLLLQRCSHLIDDQLIKCIWLAAPGRYLPSLILLKQ